MNRIKWWIRHCFKVKDCRHCCLWCQYYKSCSTDWAEPVKKEKPHYDFDTSRVKAGIMTVDKLEAKVLSYDPKIFINDHLNSKLYKALAHEEETKNAFISRQAVLEVTSRECHELRGVYADIEQAINNLPSADNNWLKCIEDIKAEIEKQIERDHTYAMGENAVVKVHDGIANGLQVAIRIIDRHVKELRGEVDESSD